MAPDGRARNGSTHGTRNGFHRRKRNFMGSAGQRKARGDPYGANLVLQAAPSLDLARMQEAESQNYSGLRGGIERATPPYYFDASMN